MNSFTESTVINFEEGLIGLADFREAALVRLPNYEPFLWLASLSDPNTRFLVIEPSELFPHYAPSILPEVNVRIDLMTAEKPLILAIVKLSPEWTKTTINLRAPIFVNQTTLKAVQSVLTETDFGLDEALPTNILESRGEEK